MSFSVTQIGATSRPAAYAAAAAVVARRDAATAPAEAFAVSATPPVAPPTDSSRAREQLRQQIMAERGLDMRGLYGMSSQDRIRAEAGIMAEISLRTRQAQDRARAELRGLGTRVDIRV
ncbi:MAG: hypothetical protein ABS78_21990 [Phenylobacterium sp. SCN 70-31]|nr:MAG: hypothetical protein ABS78_21990 [Phenylobacterium sp. SCN 70-31]